MVRAKGPVRSAFLGLLPNVLDYSAIAHWALPVVHHPQFGKKRQDFVRDRRDASRQKGHPKPKKGFVKGHLIAPSIGGGMNINFVPQLRGTNAGEFPRLENLAQKNALENVKSLYFVRTELGFVRILSQATAYGFTVVEAKKQLLRLKKEVPLTLLVDNHDISSLPTWVKTAPQTTYGHLARLAEAHGATLATFDKGIKGAFLIP